VKDLYAGGVSIVALICAAAFLLIVSPESALAQRGGPGATAAGRRTDILNRQGEQYERDRLTRERAAPADDRGVRRGAQDSAKQVKRDFEGLQAAYNKIVLAMAPKGRPDFDSISESVNEVKACAARLKANLALPKVVIDKDKARSEVAVAQTEELLPRLLTHIYRFVTNPLFEAAPVFNVEQAGKAGRDLDMILELSEGIKRSGNSKGQRE
jgi:hypothetical protein